MQFVQVHLGEGLTAEAEKLLCSLVCWFPEREIRMKFVEGCLENLKHNRYVLFTIVDILPFLFVCLFVCLFLTFYLCFDICLSC